MGKIRKGQFIILMSSSERTSMIDVARTISKQRYERCQNIYKSIFMKQF